MGDDKFWLEMGRGEPEMGGGVGFIMGGDGGIFKVPLHSW